MIEARISRFSIVRFRWTKSLSPRWKYTSIRRVVPREDVYTHYDWHRVRINNRHVHHVRSGSTDFRFLRSQSLSFFHARFPLDFVSRYGRFALGLAPSPRKSLCVSLVANSMHARSLNSSAVYTPAMRNGMFPVSVKRAFHDQWFFQAVENRMWRF